MRPRGMLEHPARPNPRHPRRTQMAQADSQSTTRSAFLRSPETSPASVLIPKSISFYAFAARVRRQKRWMLAKMSLAVFVQRNGLGSALVAST